MLVNATLQDIWGTIFHQIVKKKKTVLVEFQILINTDQKSSLCLNLKISTYIISWCVVVFDSCSYPNRLMHISLPEWRTMCSVWVLWLQFVSGHGAKMSDRWIPAWDVLLFSRKDKNNVCHLVVDKPVRWEMSPFLSMSSFLVPNPGFEREMTCRSWAQYNFETFDGLYYFFPGRCTYTLLKDCEDTSQANVVVQVSLQYQKKTIPCWTKLHWGSHFNVCFSAVEERLNSCSKNVKPS